MNETPEDPVELIVGRFDPELVMCDACFTNTTAWLKLTDSGKQTLLVVCVPCMAHVFRTVLAEHPRPKE